MAQSALEALRSWQPSNDIPNIALCDKEPTLKCNESGPGSFAARAVFALPDGGRFSLLLSGTDGDDALMPMVENELGLPDGFLIDINTYILTELTADAPLAPEKLVSSTLKFANKLYDKQRFVAPKEPAPSKQSSPESASPAYSLKRKRSAGDGYKPPTFESSRLATVTLMKQLQLLKEMDTRKDGFIAEPVEDDLYKWHVSLYFDDVDSPIAANLNELQGHDCVKLEYRFPTDYPTEPPIARIVSPHITGGHVTRHGGICMELLTTSGWAPVNSIDVVCIQIRAMLIQGKARIDPNLQSRVANYTFQGALHDLKLIVNTHQWHKPQNRPRKLPS